MAKFSRPRERAALSYLFVFALATFLALCVDAVSPVRAQPFACPGHTQAYPVDKTICTMTIKIFNNDDKHWIYPVLTMGKGPQDLWMQAWFSVTDGSLVYPRLKNYRLYINPTGTGIPPGGGISLTIPLYTQLEDPICQKNCTKDTFIDWWQGGTIQLYSSDTASPPLALQNALKRPKQQVVTVNYAQAILPKCAGAQSKVTNAPPPISCQLGDVSGEVKIYSDDDDLPKSDPNQLLEYTLGARATAIAPILVALDTRNVDFDVSYVNVAFLPATMGVVDNDQVGYTGSPKAIGAVGTAGTFTNDLSQFTKDFPGWPQFVTSFPNLPGPPPPVTILKLPSPLEIFARLSGDLPPDLTPPPKPGNWPNPKNGGLWAPIAKLYSSWTDAAGTVKALPNGKFSTTKGSCPNTDNPGPAAGAPVTTFCDAIAAVKWLMLRNYQVYRQIFSQKCSGTPVDIDDNRLIAHVYGWQPWGESATSNPNDGCPPKGNLLENTCPDLTDPCTDPNGYWVAGLTARDYKKYQTVKTAFDKLNYGLLTPEVYPFNPWVKLIHGDPINPPPPPKYIATKCAYAYSVDDALGNVQADGQGFVVAIGSTINLELEDPCSTPILISLGGTDPQSKTKFTRYAVCKATKDRIRAVNQQYRVIILNAANLGNCPIYVWDDKGSPGTNCFPGPDCKPQQYTFTINLAKGALDNCTKDPTSCPFTFFEDPENADGIKAPQIQWWANPPQDPIPPAKLKPPGSTSNLIVCTGNRAGPSGPRVCTDLGCYYPSSQNWCCTSPIASYGVFADSVPIVDAHKTLQFNVTTRPPEACTQWGPDQPQPCTVAVHACSSGIPLGPVAQPPGRGVLSRP